MSRAVRITLSLLGLGVFALLALGSTDSEEKAQETVASQAPAIVLSANELYQAYEDNEVSR